jgi:hypothetical protein
MYDDEPANGSAPGLPQRARSETKATRQTSPAVVEIAQPPDQSVAGAKANAPLAG